MTWAANVLMGKGSGGNRARVQAPVLREAWNVLPNAHEGASTWGIELPLSHWPFTGNHGWNFRGLAGAGVLKCPGNAVVGESFCGDY